MSPSSRKRFISRRCFFLCGLWIAGGSFISLLLPWPVYGRASYHIPVGSYIYQYLEKLEAEGLIRSGLLSTRPVARELGVELTLEAAENWERRRDKADDVIKFILDQLQQEFKTELLEREGKAETAYLKPVERIRLFYLYSNESPVSFNYNNRGDDLKGGGSYRLGFYSSGRVGEVLSLYANPELRYPADGEETPKLKLVEGCGALNLWGLELAAGRESLWWGPGYHGAMLLSHNAESLDMVRLCNPQPVLLPWIAKHLGPFQFTLFVARLEKDRDLSRPYLGGLRLQIKPLPYLELGVSRTALFGGGDRKITGRYMWYVLTAKAENSGGPYDGDQLASGEIKLIIPWSLQPMVLYGELGGEDEARGGPSLPGYVAGFYFPRILRFTGWELRGEYANNYTRGRPNTWYTHSVYTDGYTYKRKTIGHHMGTDGRDIFGEIAYTSPDWGRLSLSYDREQHHLSREIKERQDSYLASWTTWGGKNSRFENFRLKFMAAYNKVENADGNKGQSKTGSAWGIELGRQF